MMKSRCALKLSLFALVACAPSAPQATSTLSLSPVLDGGSYSSGGGLTIAGEIQNIGGMTGLCGVWADGNNQSALSKGRSGTVISRGAAFVGGQALHRGLGFMRQIDPVAEYGGQRANCVVTERAWQPGDQSQDVTFRIPRQVVDQESDGLGGGYQVVFRQTGPGA